MATTELRELKTDELKGRVTELRQSIFDMKAKHNTGVLDSTADLGKARREIARCLTLVREAELGLTRTPKAKAAPRAKPETEAKAEKKPAKAKKAKE